MEGCVYMAKGNQNDKFAELLSKLEGWAIRLLGFILLIFTLIKIVFLAAREF
jgi:hypothetical protein